jgi:hypothetical protein
VRVSHDVVVCRVELLGWVSWEEALPDALVVIVPLSTWMLLDVFAADFAFVVVGDGHGV